jgi:hypothetical protein
LVIYRTARGGNQVISNVDVLEEIPTSGRHARMLRAMQERFRTFGRPSPIRRTERVGDIPDIPVYPGQGSLEPIQGRQAQLEEAERALLRPDIIDMDGREIYDVTSKGSAPAKVNKINYYVRRLEAIRRTEGIGGLPWRAGRSLPKPGRIVYRIVGNEVVCYGPTDFSRWPGVIAYEIVDRGRRRRRRRNRRQPTRRRQLRRRVSANAARRRALRQVARARALRRQALRQAARAGLRMAGRRLVGRLAVRLALRAIPVVGWVMLAIDIAEIAYALSRGARFGGGGEGRAGGSEGQPGGESAEGTTEGQPGGESAEGTTEGQPGGESAEGTTEGQPGGESAERGPVSERAKPGGHRGLPVGKRLRRIFRF